MKIISKSILDNKNLSSLPDDLETGKGPALVTGLGPVHRANLAAAMAISKKHPLWVIVPDDREAEAMAVDMESFLGFPVMMLTERDFSFYSLESVSRQGEQHRLKVMDRLQSGEDCPVVCTVMAVLQRTIPPSVLHNACCSLKSGDNFPIEDVIDRLICLGYRQSEQVEGPGQFARRGGIMDIWSGSEEQPSRIEFWGDDIDSIHYFDPNSQRRTESAKSLRLIPAAEVLPSLVDGGPEVVAGKIKKIEKRLKRDSVKYDAENLCANLRMDAETLENSRILPASDRYIELIYPEFSTVADYIPPGAQIIMDQPKKCEQQAKNFIKQSGDDVRLLIEGGILYGKLSKFYVSWEKILSRLENYPVVMADSFTMGNYPLPPKTIMNLSAKQLPTYAGNGQIVAADVLHWVGEDYRCVVLTADKRRAHSMEDFLRQKGVEKVYIENELSKLPEKGTCAVTVGTLSSGMEYPQIQLAVLTDTQIMKTGLQSRSMKKKKALPAGARLGSYEDLSVGDLVVHENYGIGRFAGIIKRRTDGVEKDYVKICYAGTDCIYVPATQLDMVTKYIGAGEKNTVKLSRLGGGDWNRARTRAKAAAKEMAGELITLYATRQRTPGHAFGQDTSWQREFEDAFEYTETEDQLRCVEEIKRDMEKSTPMDRILCGDVGYGKTEVALRAVMKCVMDGYQAAILVPTTVLAQQHYQTMISRFFGFPVQIGILSRYTSSSQCRKTLKELEDGLCDIVVGTHRLLQKDVKFKKLGLLVVDEEQRFGVSHKEHIKEITNQVDVLTLSATPIPRTLNMAMSGLRDMSTLEEPPHDRMPVQTYVMEHDWNSICDAIRREVARGGQVYYLHNMVDSISRIATKIKSLMPDISVDIAHGRMDEAALSSAMDKVIHGQTQVLVCTTIIETGIDIPNVNTLIIEDADKLGLAQLHQIRGRVGRSARRASAYLTFRKDKVLSEIAEKRLEAIREFAEFNSGFRIAMRDLEIRGAGNILGAEQSGHMMDVGYDMYLKLLEEAVLEEKGEPVPARTECSADLAVNANIPDTYVKSSAQRIEIYRRIALIRTEAEAEDIIDELSDRFGKLPLEVNSLIQVALLRGEASNAGISEIAQRKGTIRFVFFQFDFERISALYSLPEWKGRIKVEAGSKPAVSLKLNAGNKILEEARVFVGAYISLKKE